MNQDIKVGVLIPQSKQYKTLDRDFLRGIKLNSVKAQFYIETIGISADEKVIIEKIQKLHFQENISIMIGFFGHHNVKQVYEYASLNNIILIASDLGAVVPYDTPKFKNVFINSFSLIESCYLLGNHFRNQGYTKISSATSYYDAGYGLLEALHLNIEGNNNLNFAGHYITPFYPRDNEAEIMNAAITSEDPDAVFSFISGVFAEENTDFLLQNGLLEKYKFYTTPFTITQKLKDKKIGKTKEINVVSSWMRSSTCKFSEDHIKTYNQEPTVFSLLGYENGIVLKALIESNGTVDLQSPDNYDLEGPRGKIVFDTETNRTIYDSHIYELVSSNDQIHYMQKKKLKNDGSFIRNITVKDEAAKIGGWQNAYLCH